MSYTIIIIGLLIFIYLREEQHKKVVNDLMDRAMSKDFVEYKEQTQEPVIYEPVTLTDEQEYWNEIEENKR